MTAMQKRIERAFQRAMNIRDSSQGRVSDAVENRYAQAYRKAFRLDDAKGLTVETRIYLKHVRSAGSSRKRVSDG